MKSIMLGIFMLSITTHAGFAGPQAAMPDTKQQTKPQEEPLPPATAPPGTPVHREYIPERPDTSKDYEEWRIEFTGGYWPFKPTGSVKTASTPADLGSDLGVQGWKSHPFASFALKPWRQHEFQFEGVPYRLSGATTLNRQVVFQGHTFTLSDAVTSDIKVNSINFNYLYDFISSNNGFAGLIAGMGYLQANAKIADLTRNAEETSAARALFPILGMAARGFPRTYRFNVNGNIKGMSFGNYGYYVQSAVAAGFSPKRTVTIQLGYSVLDADVHNKYRTGGVKVNFHGPTVSVQLRDR